MRAAHYERSIPSTCEGIANWTLMGPRACPNRSALGSVLTIGRSREVLVDGPCRLGPGRRGPRRARDGATKLTLARLGTLDALALGYRGYIMGGVVQGDDAGKIRLSYVGRDRLRGARRLSSGQAPDQPRNHASPDANATLADEVTLDG